MGERNEAHQGSRFSTRWRILSWLLLTAAIGLGAMVVTVDGILQARVGHNANAELTQEVGEFRRFASEGRDPETAGSFASIDRMLDVFLRRQQPSSGELLIGWVEGSPPRVVTGPDLPEPAKYDPTTDRALMRRLAEQPSGVTTTPGGELRWARQDVRTPQGDNGYLVAARLTEPAYREVAAIVRTMTLVAAGSLLLTALIGLLVAGRILRPIRTMQRSAERISQRDLSRRLPVQGRDDLAELATTFNAMLDRLERSFAGEQRFVHDAGRELHRPLTKVKTRLQQVLGGDVVEADQPRVLAQVIGELDDIGALLGDLSVLAQAERPDFVKVAEPVDVTRLTFGFAESAKKRAHRHWVVREVAAGEAHIDAHRVLQALEQLAENAVAHTAEGDQITIGSSWTIGEDGSRVIRFTVSDTGPGVRPEEAERIFERFTTGSEGVSAASRPGPGLGLAIVRAIADGHGGWVFVDSLMGHGSTFGLALPSIAITPLEDDDDDSGPGADLDTIDAETGSPVGTRSPHGGQEPEVEPRPGVLC